MYIVNVTDLNNCPGADTAYLGQPAPLTLDTLSTDSAVCFGQSNGYANLLATGGRPPYTYAWSGSTSVDSFAGDLAAGSQTVTVTDQGNCHASFAFAIYQPTQILITAVNVTAAHCATSHDGVAVALISGGSPAYTYTWDATSTGGIDSITGLVPGSHTLTVTDSKGCTQTGPFTIDTQYVLHIAMGSDSVTCSGGANGVAFTTALNGYPAYTYSWNSANSSGDSATGLRISSQNETVTDIYGCSASGSVAVAQPDAVTDVASFSNPTCTGFLNGKVWVSAGGTEGPYTFTFNGATRPITDTVFGLGAGTYHFTVYDAKGCPKQDSVVLSDPLKLAVPPPVIVNITCYNSNNGSIQLSPTGGTPPYTYTWSPGGYTAAQQDSLSPATYVITVTDANGCSVTRSIQMPAPSRITLLSAKSDSVSCPDSSDGHIVVDPTGGTPGDFIPYTYSINGSIYYTNHNFYNLAAGAYNISVMDSQGCTFDTVLNVYQPAPVTASVNPQDSMVALGSGIQLFTTINNATTQSINSYTWTPSVGLSCLDCPNPVASPYQATQYYLTVNYGKNCTTTASDKVLVGPGASIYIPNAFTPNGDGVNDYFEAFGTTLQSVSMKIFDRWGEKVFDSGDDQWASWDGRYRGVMQPPAVYVYLIQLVFLDGSQQTRQGSLTLIR